MTFVGRDTLATGVMPAEAGTQITSKPGVSADSVVDGTVTPRSPVRRDAELVNLSTERRNCLNRKKSVGRPPTQVGDGAVQW